MAQSSAEQFEKLLRAPTKVKIALLVFLYGVVAGGYYFFFYSDLSEHLESQIGQRRNLSDQERKLTDRKKEYSELLRKKLELEDELRRNAVMLPASSELPAFYNHLQTQAVTANVRITSFTRLEEEDVDDYVKVPVKMEVVGDFYQLNNYFKLLYETPRIITIQELTIGTRTVENEGYALKASFIAATFRQPDQETGGSGAGPRKTGMRAGTARRLAFLGGARNDGKTVV
ncbi:MAG: type 4a pilus biogenesis protein PilO [Pseudomonadota bacterium]